MADSSVAITPGAGASVSTRTNASGEHLQAVVVGIDGSDSIVGSDATNGLDVDVTRLPALPAGTNNIGDVDIASAPTLVTKQAGTTAAQTSIASTTTPNTTLIAADANRLGLTIYNDSTQILFVLWAAGTESATAYSVQIAAGGFVEVPGAFVTQRISGHWASANGSARITAAT